MSSPSRGAIELAQASDDFGRAVKVAAALEQVHFTLRAQQIQRLISEHGLTVAAAEREVDALDSILGHRERMKLALAEVEATRVHHQTMLALYAGREWEQGS